MISTDILRQIADFAEQGLQDPMHIVDERFADEARESFTAIYDAVRAELAEREHDDADDADDDPAGLTVNGWSFDPAREVWIAKTGQNTWTEIKGSFDDPPKFRPEQIVSEF